jgi:hypothetical protein
MSLSPRLRAMVPSVRRLASKGWSTDAIARACALPPSDVRSIVNAKISEPAQPKPPWPRAPAPDDWGPRAGVRDVDDLVDVLAPAMIPEPVDVLPSATVPELLTVEHHDLVGMESESPTAVAEDWGSPYASSIPGGRLTDDDPAEALGPLPATSPPAAPSPPSCPVPRPRRWRTSKGRRLDPRYRDD